MALSDLAHSNAQDVVIHHAANAAAVAIPVGAVVVDKLDKPETTFTILNLTLTAPEWVALTAGILGIIWYAILIGEKVVGWVGKINDPLASIEDPRDLVQEDHHVHSQLPPSA